MKATKEILSNPIADYFILNGYSTEQSGLYRGKVGISLLLFDLFLLPGDCMPFTKKRKIANETTIAVNGYQITH